MAWVDRSQCEAVKGDDLRMWNLLDSALLASKYDSTTRMIRYTHCDFTRIVTSQTLPDLHQCVLDSSFFAPLASTKHHMTHLLSKVINIRCQRRKFAKVADDYMHASDKELCRHVRQLLLCSLLGNYPHCVTRVKSSISRGRLYEIILTDMEAQGVIFEWISSCPFLLLNALRDYMIHCITNDPALFENLAEVMRFDEFAVIVNRTMNAVRKYLDDMFDCSTSVLSIATTGDVTEHTVAYIEWCKRLAFADLNRIIAKSHHDILSISYRRPALHSYQLLLSLRRQCPMIQKDHQPEGQMKEDGDEEDDDEEEEEEEEGIEYTEEEEGQEQAKFSLKQLSRLAESVNIEDEKKTKKKKKRKKKRDPSSTVSAQQFVTLQQYTALRYVTQIEEPLRAFALNRITNWLVHFGVSQDEVDYIQLLFSHYHDGDVSIERLKTKFQLLQSTAPHAYNLLQISAHLIREAGRHYFTVKLPQYMLVNQIQAVQKRSRYRHEDLLLGNSIHFVWCRICGTIYSMVREFDPVYTQNYRFGLRDAKVEYGTGLVYCKKDKRTNSGACQSQPLSQINLLGKMLFLEGRMITLCPGCGAIMVYDNTQCLQTIDGPVCVDCTGKQTEDPIEYKQLARKHLDCYRQCVCCTEQLPNPELCFILPCELYMCRKHAFKRFIQEIEDWINAIQEASGGREVTQEQLKEQIYSLLRKFKQERNTRNQDMYRRQHAATRQRARIKVRDYQ